MALLNKLDRKILKILQENARIGNNQLAHKIGSSPSACWNRVQRLLAKNYIKAFKAILDPEKLGLSTLVSIGVVLDRSTPESFKEFEKAIQKIPAVQECLLLAGEFDYWLKIRTDDIQSFNKMHASLLLSLPGVRQLRTFFVLNEIKNTSDLSF